MIGFFKPEDFIHTSEKEFLSSDAATMANEKLGRLWADINASETEKPLCNHKGEKIDIKISGAAGPYSEEYGEYYSLNKLANSKFLESKVVCVLCGHEQVIMWERK